MQMLRNNPSGALGANDTNVFGGAGTFAGREAAMASPLIEVLWRRRLTVAAIVFGFLTMAAMYLSVATRVYRATARISIQQNGPKVFAENQGFIAESDSFLQTQTELMQSTPVLQRALDAIDYTKLRTFAAAGDDPVSWLQRAGLLNIEAGKKSDVVSVSVDSTDGAEAAKFANSVVSSYIEQTTHEKRSTGEQMVGVLQKQKQELLATRDNDFAQMQDLKAKSQVISFNNDRSNAAIERANSLAATLTSAEVNTIDLRAQLSATKAALETPDTISAYVEAMQSKNGRDQGDKEYDELRSQLSQYSLAITTNSGTQGSSNPRVAVLQTTVDSLKKRIVSKERSMVESQVSALGALLDASEHRERELRAALQVQNGEAKKQTPEAMKYASLESEVDRLQKQIAVIDTRIAEVSVNSVQAGAMSVQVMDVARAEKKPVKPSKSMVLAAALVAGLVFGSGGAMFREWQDARVRSADEITMLFGVPVLASVPRVNSKLSSVARGQLLRLDTRSAASEAYRSVRTSLHLGAASVAKTILVASPTSGDGKSTTASNLAIAFAEAGDRTLLIDCDLRRPVQHLIFEIDGAAGLSTVMSGEAKLRDAIVPTRSPGLFVLPCGPLPGNPTELLTSKRFGRLMQALAETFDRIIIDSPPLASVADGRVLAAPADCTLLVLRVDHSMRSAAAAAVAGLEKIGANVVGAVANEVQADASTRYYGGSWMPLSQNDQMLLSAGGRTQPSPQLGYEQREPVAAGTLATNEPDWSAELNG